MKKIIFTTALLAAKLTTFGQTNSWAKSDRNLIYEECLAQLTTEFKTLTLEQRETISLCYLNEITSKYSKEDYQSKIDAELKRIKSSTIIQCSKNIGADLNKQVQVFEEKKPEATKVAENKPTRQNLQGHWKDEESEFWLFETGDFKLVRIGGSTSKGTWKIVGDLLTLNHENIFGTTQKDYKILIFTEDGFIYQSTKNERLTFKAKKIK